MFSDSAFEAYFIYLGLGLNETINRIIISEAFFQVLAAMIFGVVFFIALFKYFSQFSTGTFLARSGLPLSSVFKVIFVFSIGIMILKVDGNLGVNSYDRESWHSNQYVMEKLDGVKAEYQVSFVFDMLMRTAQEIGAYATSVVESMFTTVHSQTREPFFFYKASMYAGTVQIEDKGVRDLISFYINECAHKALAAFEKKEASEGILDAIFGSGGPADAVNDALSQIDLGKYEGVRSTCLDVKRDMNQALYNHIDATIPELKESIAKAEMGFSVPLDLGEAFRHKAASMAMVNHIGDEHESFMGVEKGAQVPGTIGKIGQHIQRFFKFAGWSSLKSDTHGAGEAIKRATEFNELLVRAPIIRGVAMMFLSAIFPLLFFWVVAMKWKVLIVWFTQLLGVCLWPAIWTLIYSIMTGAALSIETLQEFGKLTDGMSLTGATYIHQKMNFFFAIMHWLMIGAAAAINGGLFLIQRTVMSETREELAPTPVGEVASTAKNLAVARGSGGLMGGS